MGKQDLVFNEYYATYLNGGRKNNRAMNQQAATEQMYVRILTELCANRFEWKGLPDSVDKRFLEVNLIWRGLSVFYRDADCGEFFAVQGAGSGATNFMDNPVRFTVIGPDMQTKTLSAMPTYDRTPGGDVGERKPPECVPIYCNYMRTPDLDVIYLYATKLAKLDRSIEITADNMRKNKYINSPENERHSWLNILKQIAEGQEAIFGTTALDMGQLNVIDLSVDPLTLPNLQIAKSKLWNECMGLLGINNANQDKKERLVAAEVGANDEQVQATRNIALNARQQACEQINKLFGLDVSVDFVEPSAPPAEPATGELGKESETEPEKETA
jgi:hypothetical protein